QAVMGRGFDRHFFALSALAQEENSSIPELFTNEYYQYTNRFILSTSTLVSKALLVGGFAPVVSDGYGVGYMMMDDSIGSNVSTYESRDSAEFV
uniref:choline/carnitine O-acyltransferase n=1 Tax=Salmonella sp. s54836 TaxID=3159673 RepID=UPI003981824C